MPRSPVRYYAPCQLVGFRPSMGGPVGAYDGNPTDLYKIDPAARQAWIYNPVTNQWDTDPELYKLWLRTDDLEQFRIAIRLLPQAKRHLRHERSSANCLNDDRAQPRSRQPAPKPCTPRR